jgi:cob(I)alamin adenosyltransferase
MPERTKTLRALVGGGDKGTASLLGGGRAPKDDPRIEAETRRPPGFILPGGTPAAGALDVARTVVRRAERRVVAFGGADETALQWLNRVSLLLFIVGRHEEAGEGVAPTLARARRGHA